MDQQHKVPSMDPTLPAPEAVYHAIFPTAAFTSPPRTPAEHEQSRQSVSWEDSRLNPKNRIDSLESIPSPKWRIDGCTGMGTQFYTIPLFLDPLIPLRIDTFVPPSSHYPPDLQDVLDTNIAFRYRDSHIANFGIARHILRVLEHWSSKHSDFKSEYESLPFGSRILFENMDKDVRKVRIQLVPAHYLERQLLSMDTLQSIWTHLRLSSWPATLDISQVHLLRQLHDSISVVEIPNSNGGREIMILKTLTNQPKYLYHELKLLMSMPPHPNILSRPKHLITKLCKFGGKIGVAGFTTPYHHLGNLRDILPLRRIHGTLLLTDQLKWSRQVLSALLHNRNIAGQFYSDLRLDNILLCSPNENILVIDFEQRGVGAVFAAPEVNYLEYISHLAHSSLSLPNPVRQKYRLLYSRFIEPYVSPERDIYRSVDTRGFCTPWLCLSSREQESAEVYLFGSLLWCIFEGVSAPEVSLTTASRRDEPEGGLRFPAFTWRTPDVIRKLVIECTRGWKGSVFDVVRKGMGGETGSRTIQEWWRKELDEAERYLEDREKRRRNGDEDDRFKRPRLRDVLHVLEEFERDSFVNSSK